MQSSFPDIDVSDQLDQFAGIADYIGLIKEDLPGLYSMFDESLPEEVLKIATDLDMTGAQARWAEFAAGSGVDNHRRHNHRIHRGGRRNGAQAPDASGHNRV